MRNHDPTFPIVQDDTLIYQRDGQDYRLPVGTPAWYGWLSTARTFVFRGAFGTFTARKEQASNKRGGWYWRAYRRREGTLRRVYLGKSEEVTLERLNVVAMTLAGQDGVARDKREPDQRVLQGQPEATSDRREASNSAARRSSPPPVATHFAHRTRAGGCCRLYPARAS